MIALLDRKEGIYEYRVLFSVDQRRRVGDPHQGFLARRHIAVQPRASDGKHLVPQ